KCSGFNWPCRSVIWTSVTFPTLSKSSRSFSESLCWAAACDHVPTRPGPALAPRAAVAIRHARLENIFTPRKTGDCRQRQAFRRATVPVIVFAMERRSYRRPDQAGPMRAVPPAAGADRAPEPSREKAPVGFTAPRVAGLLVP